MDLNRFLGILRAPDTGGPSPFATPPAGAVRHEPPPAAFAEPAAPPSPMALEMQQILAGEPAAHVETPIVAVEPHIPAPTVAAEPAIAAATAARQVEIERSLLASAKGKSDPRVKPGDAPAVASPSSPDPALVAEPSVTTRVEPQPSAPMRYQAFKLPAGVTFDQARLQAELLDVLAPYQVPQDKVQELIDNHVKAISEAVTQTRDESKVYFNGLRAKWKQEARTDPRLRSRLETALQNGKAFIETFAVSPEDKDAIFKHLELNGMSDFPPFLRMVDNAGEKFNVFEDGSSAATLPPPAEKKNGRGWYGNSPKT